jgi:hypothetical protein
LDWSRAFGLAPQMAETEMSIARIEYDAVIGTQGSVVIWCLRSRSEFPFDSESEGFLVCFRRI